jgi:hypothetical protein
MTFERATDGTARVGAPNPRLMRVAEMVSRYSGCGNVLDVGCLDGAENRLGSPLLSELAFLIHEDVKEDEASPDRVG